MIRRNPPVRAAATVMAAAITCAAPHPALAEHAAEATTVDSVIVTAHRNREDPPVVSEARARLSETPGAVAVISAESYEGRYAPGTAELLRDVPGVYAQKKWGGDTRLSIRGSGIGNSSHNRGTLLAQDGIPLNEADGYGDFQLIDPLIARYTEVYKGGNALRFGGALLGGVVNLVTPTGRNAGEDGLVRIDGGSFGTVRGHGELARVFGEYDLFAAVTGQSVDGWRAQSEGQEQHASLSLGRGFGEDREVRLILSGGYVHQEIPGSLTLDQALTTPTMANGANAALNYQRDMGSVRGTVQARWRLSPTLLFEGGVYGTWKDLDHPIFQVLDQESRNFGLFGRFDWEGAAFGRRADAYFGAWLRRGDMDANNWTNLAGSRGPLRARSRQNAAGLDVFAEGRLFVTEALAVVAGGSYGRAERDYQSLSPTSFLIAQSVDYEWFSPRLGLLWQGESGAQVYANVTRSVEPPNFSALAPSGSGFSALRPQEAWTGEVGTRGRTAAFIWDVAVYRAELDGELLNYIPDSAAGIPATFNAGRTTHQGIEAGLDWHITHALRLRQTYGWSDFRFEGDVKYGDGRLPVVPEHLYRAELRYQHGPWWVAPQVEWAPTGAFVDYANTLKAPGYAVVNLGGGWKLNDRVSVFVDARNLADERYVSNFSAVTDAQVASTAVFFPGDGRSLYGGLTARF